MRKKEQKTEGRARIRPFPGASAYRGGSRGQTKHPASWGKNSSFSHTAWLS